MTVGAAADEREQAECVLGHDDLDDRATPGATRASRRDRPRPPRRLDRADEHRPFERPSQFGSTPSARSAPATGRSDVPGPDEVQHAGDPERSRLSKAIREAARRGRSPESRSSVPVPFDAQRSRRVEATAASTDGSMSTTALRRHERTVVRRSARCGTARRPSLRSTAVEQDLRRAVVRCAGGRTARPSPSTCIITVGRPRRGVDAESASVQPPGGRERQADQRAERTDQASTEPGRDDRPVPALTSTRSTRTATVGRASAAPLRAGNRPSCDGPFVRSRIFDAERRPGDPLFAVEST